MDTFGRLDCGLTDDNERKAYFEPRKARPDQPVIKRRAAAAVNQVVPPDIQNGFDSRQQVSVAVFCVGYCSNY